MDDHTFIRGAYCDTVIKKNGPVYKRKAKDIFDNKRCSLGNRHRLVLTLNKIYQGAHIIEDAPSYIEMLLKKT